MKRAYYLVLTGVYISVATLSSCQERNVHPGNMQFPLGYPSSQASPFEQLEHFPLPRYLPGNHLQKLFNWMDPGYMGGRGQDGVTFKIYNANADNLQEELALNWNYGIVIPNAGTAFGGLKDTLCPTIIKLANKYPGIPLDIIIFWTQGRPKVLGYDNGRPMILSAKIDSAYSITFNRDGKKRSEIKFNFPDSLIRIDGDVQKFYLNKLLKYLTRPINRINENGEEPPDSYLVQFIKDDPIMIKMKDSMKIDSWEDFVSTRKLQMRNVYSSEFMKGIPTLQNTFFSFYIAEGGPIDRFEWPIMKKCMTPLNGKYYSTPDFYPRWPKNWKDWTGAWHGWKWIEIGRKTEIKEGDYLFSPFVAAGWAKNYEENITPGQWLGLLKCLSVIGAEFYYVGYFNLSAPFNNPSDYVWQAAMPAYAQAITSRFEDVLKDGNVLFDENHQPIISYPTWDNHVLITARKANNKEKYVICGTYQPFSNDSAEIPESKNVSVNINGHSLSFEIRRQGSVYIYEKTPDNRIIFYQLDKWHENKHPERWSKDFCFEAEVADSGVTSNDIYTDKTGGEGDYTNFTSYALLQKDKHFFYYFSDRDSVKQSRFLWIRYKGEGTIFVSITNYFNPGIFEKENLQKTEEWKWVKISLTNEYDYRWGINVVKISSVKGDIYLDKFVITTNGDAPPSY